VQATISNSDRQAKLKAAASCVRGSFSAEFKQLGADEIMNFIRGEEPSHGTDQARNSMENLNPTISNSLRFVYHADEIRQTQAQLRFVPDKKRAVYMANRSRVDYVYNTAALEGNPFTYPEVKTLIEGITVGGRKISDAEQVLNLNRAFTYLMDKVKAGTFALDEKTACEIQGHVARDEALTWGVFRDGQVSIGGTSYMPPKAHELSDLFAKGQAVLSQEQDPVLKAFLVFLWGSLNQFFYDGNKRTSRLLANGILLSAGFPPLAIFAKDQLQYNEVMTRFYNSQDATEALSWLFEYYKASNTGFGFDAP
jgi:Fic family protein